MIKLLFFDTFSHDAAVGNELNLDLVQFPSPVYISEVRIIPLGARVTANFPGGVRLGATNPGNFQLELFVNNLKAPGASTFESIGTLQYNSSSCISLPINQRIATDGLVLRGLYSTITLAVYGAVSFATPDQLIRQASEEKRDVAIKDEPVGELVLPTMPLGESYAAQWTEKHKQVALKAEPPDEWDQELVPDPLKQQEALEFRVKTEPLEFKVKTESSPNRLQSPPLRQECSSPRSAETKSWKKYNDGHDKSRSWDRDKNGNRSPVDKHRDRSPLRTPMSQDLSRDRSPIHERTPRSRPRSVSRDRRQSRTRSRTPELVLHYSKSREASMEKDRYRDRSLSPRESSRKDSRDGWRRSSRDDYDRASIHSSGSRRLGGGRSSASPPRPGRSLTPRQRSNTRSPYPRRKSRSKDRRSLPSPGRPSSRSRNGCRSPSKKSPTPPKEDILDNVSDISDGDIPDLPETEETTEQNTEAPSTTFEDDGTAVRNSVVREDVEEISDEEAEWSDDVETGGLSDFEDLAENINWDEFDRETISVFDVSQWSGNGLTTFSCPTETLCEKVRLGKAIGSEGRTLDEAVKCVSASEVNEKWVENVELITKIVQFELPSLSPDHEAEIRQKLVQLAFVSIDFTRAMNQPKPTHKVRHIKSGLKLVIELLNCGPELRKAMFEAGLQSILLGLLSKEHMVTSLKLLILRTLDCSLDCGKGIEIFLSSGSYQQLVELANSGLQTRTKFGLASLLNKCHLCELLNQLVSCTEQLTDKHTAQGDVLREDLDLIADLTNELKAIYIDLQTTMSHPPRFLPSLSHFDLSTTQFGQPESGYFNMVKSSGFMEAMSVLLCNPLTSDSEPLMTSLHQLIETWLDSEPGLMFLAANPQTTELVNSLLKEDPEGSTAGVLLGEELVHLVMAVRYLDTIAGDIKRADGMRKEMETQSILTSILALYGMSFTDRGRDCLIRVLTTSNHFDCMLELVKHSSSDGKKDMKKSAIRGFASELLLLIVRLSDDMDWLRRYGDQLLELGRHDEHSKLAELVGWCGPLAEVADVFTEKAIQSLSDIVRRHLELGEDGGLGHDLVTSCRILNWLVSSRPRTTRLPLVADQPSQLKFHHAAVTMFSMDLVASFTALLTRISSDHEQPNLHTATFIGSRGQAIVAVIHPVICIIRRILQLVIRCRDTEFRDLSVVTALLKTHTLLSVVPPSSLYYGQARQALQELTLVLLAFTQPNVDLSKNNVGKSLWSQMMMEVVSYITSCPQAYVSGLTLLLTLLPLPLPLPKHSDNHDMTAVSTGRKMWSAHLHCLGSSLSKMIGTLAGLAHPPLLSVLEKVCKQLACLAPPSATLVIDGVVEALANYSDQHDMVRVETKLMQFLAWCLEQPLLKTAMCEKLRENRTAVLAPIEMCLTSARASEVQWSCLRAVANICDPSVTLRNETDDRNVMLADSLPDSESLNRLIVAVLAHLGSEFVSFVSADEAIRLLSFLAGDQYTNSFLHSAIMAANNRIHVASFLRKLVVDFSLEKERYLDCLANCLSLLSCLESTLGLGNLCLCLGWTSPEDNVQEATERRRTHPIAVLNNRVKEEAESKDELKSTAEKLSALLALLESLVQESVVKDPEVAEPIKLPESSSLLQLWNKRGLTLPATKALDDQLSIFYWMDNGDAELEDPGPAGLDMPTIDLLGIASHYLGPLDLAAEAKAVTREKTLATERKKKGAKKSLMETKALHNKNIISNFKAGGSVSIRGRGFSRSTFRPDPFRTRLPNTSRPPSLHVDDFLVLELKGQQPTGPTGYNKQSIKAAKELFAAREAENALKPPAQLREATREPVGNFRSGGRGRGDRGGSRQFRGSNGASRSFNRRDSRGWSPEGSSSASFSRTSEPRDLGRDARPAPREERRGSGFRGSERRGSGQWAEQRRFGRGSSRSSVGGEREDRSRHLRTLSR